MDLSRKPPRAPLDLTDGSAPPFIPPSLSSTSPTLVSSPLVPRKLPSLLPNLSNETLGGEHVENVSPYTTLPTIASTSSNKGSEPTTEREPTTIENRSSYALLPTIESNSMAKGTNTLNKHTRDSIYFGDSSFISEPPQQYTHARDSRISFSEALLEGMTGDNARKATLAWNGEHQGLKNFSLLRKASVKISNELLRYHATKHIKSFIHDEFGEGADLMSEHGSDSEREPELDQQDVAIVPDRTLAGLTPLNEQMVAKYFEKHGINNLFEEFAEQFYNELPADPLQAMLTRLDHIQSSDRL